MKFKKGFQTGLGFGVIMTLWYIISPLIFREGSGEINWPKNIIAALISGIVAGLLFGLIMNWFSKSKVLKPKSLPGLQTGEIILFETGANHSKGWEAVGGYLYLTNKNLIFKSHRFNFQNHELLIPLDEIVKVNRYKTPFGIDKGLAVQTAAGVKEKFVVEQAAEWLHQLTTGKTGLAHA